MRFRTTDGRQFSAPARDVLRVASRIRQWRIAGTKITTAEDLLAELDSVSERHPIHIKRVECLRSSLIESVLQSVISIPMEVA